MMRRFIKPTPVDTLDNLAAGRAAKKGAKKKNGLGALDLEVDDLDEGSCIMMSMMIFIIYQF